MALTEGPLPSTASQFPGAGDVLNLISQSNTKMCPVPESPSRPVTSGRAINAIVEYSNFEDSSTFTDENDSLPVNSVAVDMREGRAAQGDHADVEDTENVRHVETVRTRTEAHDMGNWLVLLCMILISNCIFFLCYFENNVKQFIEDYPYVSLVSVIGCISLALSLEFTLTLRNKNPLVWILNICLVVSIGLWTGTGVLIYDIKTALMAKCWVLAILLLYFTLPKKNYKDSIAREAEIVFALVATIIIVLVAVACRMKTSFVLIGVTGLALALMSLSLVCEHYMKRDLKHVHKAFALLEGIFYPVVALYLYLINLKKG